MGFEGGVVDDGQVGKCRMAVRIAGPSPRLPRCSRKICSSHDSGACARLDRNRPEYRASLIRLEVIHHDDAHPLQSGCIGQRSQPRKARFHKALLVIDRRDDRQAQQIFAARRVCGKSLTRSPSLRRRCVWLAMIWRKISSRPMVIFQLG